MKKNGFTLVELLVAIGIIAILSTIGLTVFSSTQSKARDSVRKNDLNTLATVLEVYLQKNGRYIKNSPDCQTDPDTSTFYANIKNYISDQIVPEDPKTNQAYCYISEDGDSFRLFAKLENCSDPNIIPQRNCEEANYNYSLVSDDITTITSAPGDTAASSAPPKPFSCENYGDVDNNRQINNNDASMILKYDNGQITLTDDQKIIANVNAQSSDDRTVDISDAQHISSYLAGQINQFNTCAAAKPPPCNGFGDASGDGKVTWMDAWEALRISLRKNSLYTNQPFTDEQRTRANVANPATNLVDSSDATSILRYVDGIQTSFETCPKNPPCDGYGDVDLDGQVSYADVVMARGLVGSNVTDEQTRRADVDNTKTVTSSDVLTIRNYLNGAGTSATTFPAVCP